jgi:PAS domain S-box-containing protein
MCGFETPMSERASHHPEARPSASARLKAHKERVLELWRDRVRQGIPSAKAQNEPQLRDSLPRFLDLLAIALSPERPQPLSSEELNAVSQEHGKQRASLEEYSLQQMLWEYQFLREILFGVLEQEAPLTPTERDILLSTIEQAMAEAGASFMRFVQLRERAAEERYRLIIESVKEHAIIRISPDGRIFDWNAGAENLFQYRKDEVYGQEVRLLLTPEELTQGAAEQELKTAMATGKAEDRRWHVRKDGSRFFSNGVVNLLRDAEGHLLGFVKVLRDDTERINAEAERKKAAEALSQSEERFRQISNALPQIIWTATAEFFVDWYNDWWYKYLGLPRGTRWDDSDTLPMHPEDVERTRPRLKEAVESGKDFFMEQRFRRGSDGQYRWHLVRGVPVRDSDGRIVKWIGANTDIHDQKTLTTRLEEERELRERFVATLSHDLRTPLTTAKLNAQMLARKGSDPTVLHKLTARISENLDRADQMIRDLLDANRIQAGEKLSIEIADCDLTAVARDTLEELSLVHGDRFVLNAPEVIQGYWSCSGIRRIIENLCHNAIKYGSHDRPVTIRLARHGPDEVSISVHNWGEPVSPEDQQVLFQPYRRTGSAQSGAQKGWGLGLTLVEGLAKAHRGRVEVESTRETGTTFTVTLARDPRR